MRIENADFLFALAPRPAPYTAPTYAAGADIRCASQLLEIMAQLEKRTTPLGCGGTVKSFGRDEGTGRIEKLTTGTAWNFATSGGATPQGMAFRLQLKVNAAASAYTVYEGIVERWTGTISTQADTAETIELALITNWATEFGG